MSVAGNIDVVVTGVRQVAPQVREYLLRSTDGEKLPPFGPGAHIELYLGSTMRHYSLLGGAGLVDDPADTYRIAVQREDRDRGSARIHDTFVEGTLLEISRPKNSFPLDRRDQRSLLIAGGIGITPIYAMLRSLVRRRRPFQMIYIGSRLDRLAYTTEVAALGGDSARLNVTRGVGAGRPDLAALLAMQSAGTTAYVCGPGSLIEATHDAADELGWEPSRVRSERFGTAPSGDDRPFTVELRRSGIVIPVGPTVSILDALIAAGRRPLSDCRRGDCGLCPLRVTGADGPIDHRDHFLSATERADGTSICICVSRVRGDRLVLDA